MTCVDLPRQQRPFDISCRTFVRLIIARCNAEVFQAFLATMAEEVPAERGKQVHRVLERAGWHKSARIDWHQITPVYLSAYCPDFNPIERLWQYLTGQAMTGFLTSNGEALTTKLLESLQALLEEPKLIRLVCATSLFFRK
jgi:hypothetical protein